MRLFPYLKIVISIGNFDKNIYIVDLDMFLSHVCGMRCRSCLIGPLFKISGSATGTLEMTFFLSFYSSCIKFALYELSVAQLVKFLVVNSAHQSSSPWLDAGALIFLDLILDLTGAILSVVGDMPADGETPDFVNFENCWLSLSEVLIGMVACICS